MKEDKQAHTISDLESLAQDNDLEFGITWIEAERAYYGWVEQPFVANHEFKRISDFAYLVNAMVEFAKGLCEPNEAQL